MGKGLLHLRILYLAVLFATSVISEEEENPTRAPGCNRKYGIVHNGTHKDGTLVERCLQRWRMLALRMIDEHGNINMTVVKKLHRTLPPWVDADLQQQLQEGLDECYKNRNKDFSNDYDVCRASNDFALCMRLERQKVQAEARLREEEKFRLRTYIN